MRVDIFSLIEEIKKEFLIKKHPFMDEDISLRYAYGIGLSLILHQKGEVSTDGEKLLEEVCLGLDLSQDQIHEILKAGTNPDKDMLKTVINTLDKVQYQILFLLDAQLLLKNEETEKEIVEKLVVSFMQLFKMSVESQKAYREISNDVLNVNNKDKENDLQKLFNTEASSVILDYVNFRLFIAMLQKVFNTEIQNVYNFSAYYLTDNFNTKMQDWNLVIDEIKKCIIKEEQEVRKLNQDIETVEKEKQGVKSTGVFHGLIFCKNFDNMVDEIYIDEDSKPRWKELKTTITEKKELKEQTENHLKNLKQNLEVFQQHHTLLQTALDNLYRKN